MSNSSANRLGITRCVPSARRKASGLRSILLGIIDGPGFDDIIWSATRRIVPSAGAKAGRGNLESVIQAMRFTDNFGAATEVYPFNPNGSPSGLTAVTTQDGRFTAMMPHPERVFRNIQMSWTPLNRDELSPWMQLWRDARRWVG